MAISIQMYSNNSSALSALADSLNNLGLFSYVTYSDNTLTAVKNSISLFTIGGESALSYTWKNMNNTTINYGSSVATPSSSCIATCKNGVMLTYTNGSNIFTYVFGKTKEDGIYMGFSLDHTNYLDQLTSLGGTLTTMCENTETMYGKAFLTETNSYWSRFVPICTQSNAHIVETTKGIFGFVERYTIVPITSASSISPSVFSLNFKKYLTDGSFVILDE